VSGPENTAPDRARWVYEPKLISNDHHSMWRGRF